ncbi:ester cyclase [Candidatus Bathyarchaeota archaeon]|nr:ester cyclase [Candidatus Bathyarchaeota archaeon]
MIAEGGKFKPNRSEKPDSTELYNIELVKMFYKYVDSGRLDKLEALFTPKAKIFYESGDPVSFDEMVLLIKRFYSSFPDFKHGVEEIFAAGDKVIARISYTGTFKNNFIGFEPNGMTFKYAGIHIFQLKDEMISVFWGVEDELGMMTQLGFELKPK